MQIQKEQLLVYWLYTYFCGAVYDEKIFAKRKNGGDLYTLHRRAGAGTLCPETGKAGTRGAGVRLLPILPGTGTLGSEPEYAGRTAGSGRGVFTGTSDDTV